MTSVFGTNNFTQFTTDNYESIITALNRKVESNLVGAPGGLAVLDANAKITTSELPPIAISEVYVVPSITERNQLTVQTGDVCTCTDSNITYIYDGSQWLELSSRSITLSQLLDTAIVNPANGNFLKYDSTLSKWIPGTVVSALSGLSDVDVSQSLLNNQYLTYDGSKWVNTSLTLRNTTSMYVDSLVSVTGDGSFNRPYKTIQEALNTVPVANTNALGKLVYVIHVAGGQYDESLSIDIGRKKIILYCDGVVCLGQFDGATFTPSGTPRNITLTGTQGSINSIRHSFSIVSSSVNNSSSTHEIYCTCFRLSGTFFATSSVSTSLEVNFKGVQFFGYDGVAGGNNPSINTTGYSGNLNCFMHACRLYGTVIGGTLRIQQAHFCRFDNLTPMVLATWSQFNFCEITGMSWTVQSNNEILPGGIFNSVCNGTYTASGSANNTFFAIDDYSNYLFVSNGCTTVGCNKYVFSKIGTSNIENFNISSPANGHLLMYDGSKWINNTTLYNSINNSSSNISNINTSITSLGNIMIFRSSSGWKYTSTNILNTDWKTNISYDTSIWSNATTPAGWGLNGFTQATTITSEYTVYFRYTFNLLGGSLVTGINLNRRINDGCIIYINGTEIYRFNLPAGSPTHTISGGQAGMMYAIDNLNNDETFTPILLPQVTSPFIDGLNIVSVILYQSNSGNGKGTFDLQLDIFKKSYQSIELSQDVTLTNLTDQQILKYNSTSGKWINVTSSLSTLSDVSFNNLSDGDQLLYDAISQKFVNSAGLLTFTYLSSLADCSIGTPLNNQVLKYSTIDNKWINDINTLYQLYDTQIDTPTIGNILSYGAGGKWVNTTHAHSLQSLSNVNVSSIGNNHLLTWDTNSSKWVNKQLSLNAISGVYTDGIAIGNILKYDGSLWVNSPLEISLTSNVTDVAISNATDGQVLSYSSGKWRNATGGGGGGGSVSTLTDVTLTSLTNLDILSYDSVATKWKNSTRLTSLESRVEFVEGAQIINNGAINQLIANQSSDGDFRRTYNNITNTPTVIGLDYMFDGAPLYVDNSVPIWVTYNSMANVTTSIPGSIDSFKQIFNINNNVYCAIMQITGRINIELKNTASFDTAFVKGLDNSYPASLVPPIVEVYGSNTNIMGNVLYSEKNNLVLLASTTTLNTGTRSETLNITNVSAYKYLSWFFNNNHEGAGQSVFVNLCIRKAAGSVTPLSISDYTVTSDAVTGLPTVAKTEATPQNILYNVTRLGINELYNRVLPVVRETNKIKLRGITLECTENYWLVITFQSGLSLRMKGYTPGYENIIIEPNNMFSANVGINIDSGAFSIHRIGGVDDGKNIFSVTEAGNINMIGNILANSPISGMGGINRGTFP